MKGGIQLERKKKSKRTHWIILVTVAVLVVAAAVWFVKERPWEQIWPRRALEANPGLNQIATAFIGDLSATTTASGQLLPQREAHLALGMAGRVRAVYVQVGDEVHAGDVLIQLETSSLERAVRSAEQTLAIQEANLAQLRKGASDEEIAVAKATLESAKAGLAQAQARLISARSALTQAQLSRDALANADVTAEANLKSAQAALSSAQAQLAALLEGADAETVEQARLNWEQAKNTLWSTQLERDAVYGNPASPGYLKDQMKAAVANAEIAVRLAEIKYLQAQKGATAEAIAAAKATVAAAEAQVANAQAQLDAVDDQIAQAEAAVAQAEATVAQAEAGVLQAEAAVAQAEANLAMLLRGASEEKLAIAEAQVEQARIALEEARDNLAKATLVAPFDGVVTKVYVQVGEWASGVAVDLMDYRSLEVVLDVDEMDIGSLAIGQQAVVILEAWPEEELTGEIVSIAPKANKAGEIVTYQVHLRMNAGKLPIRSGMTANAELITARRENVLLVPNRAIIADRQAGKYYVNRIQGDTVVKTEVTIGLRDKNYTEITSGLSEGDQLFIGEVSEKLDFRHGPPEEIRRLRP